MVEDNEKEKENKKRKTMMLVDEGNGNGNESNNNGQGKGKKYYVVWLGRCPGVYTNWNDCKVQTDAFRGAKFKSFETLAEADVAFGKPFHDYVKPTGHKHQEEHDNFMNEYNKKKSADKNEEERDGKEGETKEERGDIVEESMAVDAACSGNPGKLEYRGVHTKTKELYFHKQFEHGTNNIGEFLALVAAIQNNSHKIIYSDSHCAIAWLKKKAIQSTMERTDRTKLLWEEVDRALQYLQVERNHVSTFTILKWNTKKWGEIPADFNRK
jgi:ribonuclease HI